MNNSDPLSNVIVLMNDLLSPQPVGNMDVDLFLQLKQITEIKNYLHEHNAHFSTIKGDTNANIFQFFYLLFEIVDYFGVIKDHKSIQVETYNLSMTVLDINGVLYKYALMNPQGTAIFYKHMNWLGNQFLLHQELLPDLFDKVNFLRPLTSSNTDTLKVVMSTCMFQTALTRIIVNYETQAIKEGLQGTLQKAMEEVLRYNFNFVVIIPKENITDGYKNNMWELIYRVELSPHLFYGLDGPIKAMEPFILPRRRENQFGRTALRVAIVSAEMDLRQALMALRCFQFDKVVQICETIMIRLSISGYFTSDHAGSGAMCFNGFSMKFNEVVDKIISMFEKMCLWGFSGGRDAGESISKVCINVFNLPAKKGWEGPWSGLNDRVINMINTMSGLKDSETFNKLFSQ